MMTKIMFTVIVIVIVGMIFAKRSNEQIAKVKAANQSKEPEGSISSRALAYSLIALLIMVSGVVYYFSWSSDNQLVTLRLVGLGGHVSEFQAYKKDIKDRSFTTISGKQIRMADSDRMELLE